MPARWVELVALVALGWALAVPVTAWFARATWTAREPVAALVAWQAVGLGGGLATLTAELTLTAVDRPGPWRSAVVDSVSSPHGGWAVVGLLLFAVSLAWLAGVLVVSFVRAARTRRRHRGLLAVLARPDPEAADVDVVDTGTPVAYSVPGRAPRVVLSSAATTALAPGELRAVVAHERAHLRQRHSLLVQPFVAWERSLRMVRAPAAARRRVEQLVEMVCDDAACRTCEAADLGTALHTLGADGPSATERLARLAPIRRSPAIRWALYVAAALVVLAPPAVLLAIPG